MTEMKCPNCGQHLVGHRNDRQTAGDRQVLLHWMICTSCRHVALRDWTFADSASNPSSANRARTRKVARPVQGGFSSGGMAARRR